MADATQTTGREPQSGVRLEPQQVVLRPLVTEKSVHRSTRNKAYAFEVHSQATKIDVRRAIEELFNVKVAGVRTQNRLGKRRRSKFRQGMTKPWKKAIVTLAGEDRIEFF